MEHSSPKFKLVALYALRRYGAMLLTALVSALVSVVLVAALAPSATRAGAAIARAKATEATEIVVTSVDGGFAETFYYFDSGTMLVTPDLPDRRIGCDLLMAKEGAVYADNFVRMEGALGAGECAVSENLMRDRGLAVGDEVVVRGTDISFRIAKTLAAQRGLDGFTENAADRDGIVVLAYDGELLSLGAHRFVAFPVLGDAYYGLEARYLLEEIVSAARVVYWRDVGIAAGAIAIYLVATECLLSRLFGGKYRLWRENGATAAAIFGGLVLHEGAGYVLPAVAVFLLAVPWFVPFAGAYLRFALFACGIAAGAGLAAAAIRVWRVVSCHRTRSLRQKS